MSRSDERPKRGQSQARGERPLVACVEPLEVRTMLSSAAFKVVTDWGSGFGGQITITNTGSQPVDNWTLEFDFGRSIDSIWDGQVVSKVGTRYTVKNAGWNSTIAAGGTASFGFNGSPGNVGTDAPRNYVLNGVKLDGSTSPAAPTLSVGDASTVEGNSGTKSLVFRVSLSPAATSTVTVKVASANGTALAGTDYNALAGTLSFAPGETSKDVSVAILGDTSPEPSETFSVSLSGPVGAAIGRSVATGTIVNDDTYPQAQSLPAVPSLSVQSVAGKPGTYLATFNIWWGQNATSWRLLENGKTIYTGALTASTPNPQTATYQITGKSYGVYQYQAVALNAAGSTASAPTAIAVGGASKILIPGADVSAQSLEVTVPLGLTSFAISDLGTTSPRFRVTTNNASVARPSLGDPTTLAINALAPGFTSVRITDDATGETRYLGVRVKDASGALPALPDTLAVGSVSEDTPSDLAFFRGYAGDDTNKRVDIRYIYLNGGPENGWRTWSDTDGGRLTSYLRESQKLGQIPYLVYYNIPDGGESYTTNLAHIGSRSYMQGYFRDLKFTLDTIRAMSPDRPVGMILEPDFLGYLMQNSGKQADQIAAMTDAIYDAGALTRGVDPTFSNTVQGLVNAINYLISKAAPNVTFGWQFNLWASPGLTTAIPAKGLMRLTDTMGIAAGRAAIASEAKAIAQYYIRAGVLSHGAKFVSIDKYGLDAGAENGAAANPAGSTWFWNADHWNNYLLFAKTLHDETKLPVTLWQLPVGHINGSTSANPYTGGTFADQANVSGHYEDSAPDFFLGDSFTLSGERLAYFAKNQGKDPKITVSGNTVTWGSHMAEAAAAGINAILFGAGVGDSTHGTGSPPGDAGWWITQVQRYYKAPVKR